MYSALATLENAIATTPRPAQNARRNPDREVDSFNSFIPDSLCTSLRASVFQFFRLSDLEEIAGYLIANRFFESNEIQIDAFTRSSICSIERSAGLRAGVFIQDNESEFGTVNQAARDCFSDSMSLQIAW
jgi:hypothetical protein